MRVGLSRQNRTRPPLTSISGMRMLSKLLLTAYILPNIPVFQVEVGSDIGHHFKVDAYLKAQNSHEGPSIHPLCSTSAPLSSSNRDFFYNVEHSSTLSVVKVKRFNGLLSTSLNDEECAPDKSQHQCWSYFYHWCVPIYCTKRRKRESRSMEL